MKNFKFIYLFIAFVGALTMASCEHPYADYTPGAQDETMGVYFPSTEALVVKAEDTSVDIAVARVNAEEAAEVKVRFQEVVAADAEPTGFFTVPSTVSFEAGATETTLTVSFDGTQLTPGVQYRLNIQLDQSIASKYGLSDVVFNLGIAEPWITLEGPNGEKTGFYRDDFMGPLYGGASGTIVDATIVQHEFDKTRYRLVEPYGEKNVPYLIGGVPEDMTFTTPGYVEFWLYEDNTVEIPSSWLGFTLDVGTGKPEDFYLATVYKSATEPMLGEFKENVFWFTTPKSIMWHIPDGRGNYANQNGMFAVSLPGYEISDYAINISYAGMFVNAVNEASAVLDFALGLDVESYKFTLLEGNPTAEVLATTAAQIADGTAEFDVLESRREVTRWEVAAEKGLWTVVAVPFGKKGAVADKAVSYNFYFPGVGGGNEEKPQAEISYYFRSIADLTGNAEMENDYPAAYFIGLGIKANGDELRSIKAWVGDAALVEGLEDAYVIEIAGDDFTKYIDNIKANGSVILGPFNLRCGSKAVAIVEIVTLYGDVVYKRIEADMPNATGLELGSYTIAEGEYKVDAEFLGGYEPGEVYFSVDGFEFPGVLDAEKKTVSFDGSIDGYNVAFNGVAFYYNDEKTQVFGYYSYADAEDEVASDLVFSYNDANEFSALNNYFSMRVFDYVDGKFEYAFDEYAFTPAATVAKAVAEEETPAEPSKLTKSAKNMEANYTLSNVTAKCDVKAFNGRLELKNKAQFGF